MSHSWWVRERNDIVTEPRLLLCQSFECSASVAPGRRVGRHAKQHGVGAAVEGHDLVERPWRHGRDMRVRNQPAHHVGQAPPLGCRVFVEIVGVSLWETGPVGFAAAIGQLEQGNGVVSCQWPCVVIGVYTMPPARSQPTPQ